LPSTLQVIEKSKDTKADFRVFSPSVNILKGWRAILHGKSLFIFLFNVRRMVLAVKPENYLAAILGEAFVPFCFPVTRIDRPKFCFGSID
jgi:hypothetical protein